MQGQRNQRIDAARVRRGRLSRSKSDRLLQSCGEDSDRSRADVALEPSVSQKPPLFSLLFVVYFCRAGRRGRKAVFREEARCGVSRDVTLENHCLNLTALSALPARG